MKVKIIDDNHIMLVASNAEISEFSNHIGVLIDNKDSYVCNSEPSSSAFEITRPVGGIIFNIPLDISSSPFTTNEILIIYLKMANLTFPIILLSYDNNVLLDKVAANSGLLDTNDELCVKDNNKANHIVMYYQFKLCSSILDIRNAIKYYNNIFNIKNITSECNCHGN